MEWKPSYNLLIIGIVFLFTIKLAEASVSSDQLLYYYKLDVNSATQVDSHNSNNGTASGCVYNAGGFFNGAYSFDGNSDYISLPSSPPTGTSNRTITMWIYPTSADPNDDLFHYGTATTGQRFRFKINDNGATNTLRIEIQGSGYTSSLAPTLNAWNFIAIRFTGSTLGGFRFTINDTHEQASGANGVNTASGTTALIGARDTASTLAFEGFIDEVGIFDEYLSDAEVEELFNSGNGLEYPFGGEPTDTCTYGGSGDWIVQCSDVCSLETNTDIGVNTFWINGSGGSVSLLSNITANKAVIDTDCSLNIEGGRAYALII